MKKRQENLKIFRIQFNKIQTLKCEHIRNHHIIVYKSLELYRQQKSHSKYFSFPVYKSSGNFLNTPRSNREIL